MVSLASAVSRDELRNRYESLNACSGMMSRIDCARYLAYSTVCFLSRLVSHATLTTFIHTTIAFLSLLRLPLTLLLLPYAITATLIPFRLIPSTNPYPSSSTPHLPSPYRPSILQLQLSSSYPLHLPLLPLLCCTHSAFRPKVHPLL